MYKNISLHQLLEEYYYNRKSAHEFFSTVLTKNSSDKNREIYTTLLNNIKEIEAEIERRIGG